MSFPPAILVGDKFSVSVTIDESSWDDHPLLPSFFDGPCPCVSSSLPLFTVDASPKGRDDVGAATVRFGRDVSCLATGVSEGIIEPGVGCA